MPSLVELDRRSTLGRPLQLTVSRPLIVKRAMMKLLIIGGTVFLGRHLAEAALARGHAVTLFNRGRHNPDLFPEVEKLRGDRTSDLSALQGRSWDAVIDTCGYVPREVRASVDL